MSVSGSSWVELDVGPLLNFALLQGQPDDLFRVLCEDLLRTEPTAFTVLRDLMDFLLQPAEECVLRDVVIEQVLQKLGLLL